MLVELSKMEQRYEAVLAVVRDGLSVGEMATAFGVSRQSICRWMQPYDHREDGPRCGDNLWSRLG